MSTVATLGSSQIQTELGSAETRLDAPITNLDNQITTDKAEISAWGSIGSAVSKLSTSLTGISDVATINTLTATSTSTSVATATATLGAQTGTFNLSGVTLAKSQQMYSALESSAGATLAGGAGSLTFSLANGKTETVSVGSGSLTLNGVAAAINKQAGGVQASIIGTSTGARLVLQSSGTGSSQAFTVAGTGGLAAFSYNPASASASTEVVTQPARNASLSINGVPITNASNTLGSAISGATITLTGSGTTTVTIAASPAKLSAAVSSVATSLNAAISTIATQIKYVPASSGSAGSAKATVGPLLGNFTATNLSDQLMTAVSGAAASGMSAAGIGLSISSTGAVSFSSATFSSAYAKNPTAVESLVTQIYSTLDGITAAAIGTSAGSAGATTSGTASTGSIGAQTSSLNASVTSIDSQITEINKQNNAQLEILVNEYSAAEAESTAAQVSAAYLSIFTGSGSSKS
jgi:flagellar hook-associated protein 2